MTKIIHIQGLDIPEKIYSMPVFLYGAGNTGKVLGNVLMDKGVSVCGYIDDDPAKAGGG